MRTRYKKKSKRTGKYKSQLEALVAKRLGRKAKYEPEAIHYLIPKKYIPDFVIQTSDNKVYLEVKGWFRYEDQAKMRAVKASNPTLDIRFYFPKDQKIHGSKMLNSEWCEKYNFPCYVGSIPKDWIN